MKLLIATDHNGVEYKKKLTELLVMDGYVVEDMSEENTPTDDYPDFAFKLSHKLMHYRKVDGEEDAFGILICGTGIGMCIAANKVKGILCALVRDSHAAYYARYHDDANVIALDSSMNPEFAFECIKIFVNTKLCRDDEKYYRRIKKVLDYEVGEYNEL